MKKLCINIDSDTESWELSKLEFARIGMAGVERFPAVVENNRVIAFNKSVYGAMQAPGDDYLLLMEDDVQFEAGFKWADHKMLLNPQDMLTLHLGCNIIGTSQTVWEMPTACTNDFALLHNCWQSHCTIYSPECVKMILEKFNPNVCDNDNPIFDEWLRQNILPLGRSYVANPMVAWQRPRKSEIWGVHADYTGAHTQGNKWLKENL